MDVRLSEAELEVMEVLWGAAASLSATDIAAQVAPERRWSLATTVGDHGGTSVDAVWRHRY